MVLLYNGEYPWNLIMANKIISIATDYSVTPAGRYPSDGSYSGERFREEFLYPALQNYDKVEINLDKTLGYGSSFLEEAFGGLIREKKMTLEDIQNRMSILSSRVLYKERIWKYLEDAQLIEINKNK